MPDGLQVILGGGWGPARVGQVAEKEGKKLRLKLKCNIEYLSKQPIYKGIILSDIKDSGIFPTKSAFLYTDHSGNYLGFLRIL